MSEPNVMTPDGRRQVAIQMLNDWREAENTRLMGWGWAEDEAKATIKAGLLLEEILELMGVD